jgi:hypothetical protein
LIDLINSIHSAINYEKYDDWRCEVDRSVASVNCWLQELGDHGDGDVMLRATAAAAPAFLDLISGTLAALLEHD